MTKQKEKFNPITPGKVAMYVCGVISYDFSHIGHARAYVAFDFLFRYLKYLGYEVKYVRNFTDVDDKDWGFFVPYLIGSIFLVVLAVGVFHLAPQMVSLLLLWRWRATVAKSISRTE
ncbi:hypothetical protein L1887_32635 [Cichorium endivia]|nr:hypothetical protein L1887_32635 [Cichorium endivia]